MSMFLSRRFPDSHRLTRATGKGSCFDRTNKDVYVCIEGEAESLWTMPPCLIRQLGAKSVDHVLPLLFSVLFTIDISSGQSDVCLFTISWGLFLRVLFHLFFSSFLFFSLLFSSIPHLSFFFLIIHTRLHPRLIFNISTMATERPAMLISTHSSGSSDEPDRLGTSPVRFNSFDSSLGCLSLSLLSPPHSTTSTNCQKA